MAKPGKTETQIAEDKALRAAKRAQRLEGERKAAEAGAQLRAGRCEEVRAAQVRLEEMLEAVQSRQHRREALADHATGFYEEIDKLAKGKAMLEVTPMVLEETNQIIRDAKSIVSGDPYLDRLKEFIAAGNNPVYPDVVVALRSVRQALDRATARLDDEQEGIDERIAEAATMELGLLLTEDDKTPPRLGTVKERMAGDPSSLDTSWFPPGGYGSQGDQAFFDLGRIMGISSMPSYFDIEDAE